MRLTSLFCSLFLAWGASEVHADRITVDKNGPVSKITQALQLVSDGDTILVKSGIYREGNILIEKPISIIGQGYPVLDGENKFEIMTVSASQVTVMGFKFINTGVASMEDIAGISVNSAKGVRILNNHFENSFFGIYFSNSTDSWVEDNVLEGYSKAEHQIGNGIHMWKCKNMMVNRNRIKGHRDGIYFEFVTDSKITANESVDNMRYGLHFMFSHNDEYRENVFKSNGAGVAVMYTHSVKMIDNTFDYNWGSSSYGLLLKDIRDSFVDNNIFRQNSVGIFMEGTSRTRFESNSFVRNGYAVKLQASCDDNFFVGNNFSSNTFDIATNGTMVLNKIQGNYWDRYDGYDLNKDGVGDVPYRPVSMYAMIVEQIPTAILLWRSFLVVLLDRAEKVIPVMTPESLLDDSPSMKPHDIGKKYL